MEADFEKMQHVGMFALAACILRPADNIGRTYVREKLRGNERERVKLRNEVRLGITVGKILWAAGNAARHYDGEPLNAWNEEVLGAFNIEPRDEQSAFLLLEAAGIRTEADLLRELDAILNGMDEAIREAKAANRD